MIRPSDPPNDREGPQERNVLASSIIRRFGFLIILVVIGIGAFIFRDRLSGNAADLRVGDCFNVPAVETEVKDVQHQPCNETHTAEVFFVVDNPAGASDPYPTSDARQEYVKSVCVQPFIDYVGTSYENSKLEINWFSPTQDGWSKGDRTYTCFVVQSDSAPLTGSVKGSKQ
jgi:hypothetical protein